MQRRHTLTRTLRTLLGATALSVCLHAQDPSARVIEMNGQVSVMSDVNGYAKALNQGDLIQPQRLIVTGPDGYARLQVVSDGSTFEVFPNSRVMYRENRGNWMDLLNVYLGRIKVFITHKPGGNPNQVSSPTAVISVRGTIFDVEVKDDETTIISVDEGLVMVKNTTALSNLIPVGAGESLTVIPGQPLAGSQKDHSGAIQAAYRAAREAIWQVLAGRRPGVGAPGGPAAGGGAQGDKGKGGGTSGSPAPGSPPGGPAPSSPPGGPPGGGQ
jgi:hypothetical protein